MTRNNSTRAESQAKTFKGSAIRSSQSDEILGSIKEDSGAKTLDIAIEFKGNLWNHMEYIWTSTDKNASPKPFPVSEINLKGVDALSRKDKRGMLQELAKTSLFPKRQVKIANRKGSEFLNGFPGTDYLTTAAIFVISIALRGRKSSPNSPNVSENDEVHREFVTELFAELVGCATADTIDELSKYLRPPLLELEHVPTFIHCAVRQIARGKENRSHEPVKLTMCTIEAVGAALDQFQANNKGDSERPARMGTEKNTFDNLLRSTLSKATIAADDKVDYTPEELEKQYSRDLGCHAGLLIAGFQRYIFRTQAKAQERKALCDLFIDVSTGMLTGIPLGGFVFGPVGSLAKFSAAKWLFDKYGEERRQLSEKIKQFFDESLAAPIFFDGEFVEKKHKNRQEKHENGQEKLENRQEKHENGQEKHKNGQETGVVHKADWEEFSKWYDQVISWNHTNIKQLGDKDEEEKKEKKEKKKKEKKEKKKEMPWTY